MPRSISRLLLITCAALVASQVLACRTLAHQEVAARPIEMKVTIDSRSSCLPGPDIPEMFVERLSLTVSYTNRGDRPVTLRTAPSLAGYDIGLSADEVRARRAPIKVRPLPDPYEPAGLVARLLKPSATLAVHLGATVVAWFHDRPSRDIVSSGAHFAVFIHEIFLQASDSGPLVSRTMRSVPVSLEIVPPINAKSCD